MHDLLPQLVESIRSELTLAAPPETIADKAERHLLVAVKSNDIYEYLEAYTGRLKRFLLQERRKCAASGCDAWFEFNSLSDNHIQGPYYVEPSDSEAVSKAKTNRLQVEPIRQALEALHFSEFETLCAATLYLLGTRDAHQTTRSRDQSVCE